MLRNYVKNIGLLTETELQTLHKQVWSEYLAASAIHSHCVSHPAITRGDTVITRENVSDLWKEAKKIETEANRRGDANRLARILEVMALPQILQRD